MFNNFDDIFIALFSQFNTNLASKVRLQFQWSALVVAWRKLSTLASPSVISQVVSRVEGMSESPP